MRVLITGSRDWLDKERIWADLDMIYCSTPSMIDYQMEKLVVVNGAAQGADEMSTLWVKDAMEDGLYVALERYPAEWNKFGKRAGYIRNAKMIETRPDLCLAYIRNDSKGATMCAKLAQAAGIETRIYRIED